MSMITFVIFTLICNAQTNTTIITGKVISSQEQSVPFADVFIESLVIGTTTDIDGNYTLENVPEGNYLLTASSLGYATKTKKISIKRNSSYKINFFLVEESNNLVEVIVAGKSKTALIKEQPYTVSSIDVQSLKALNLDINQILNTSTGVKIRESGGLGSTFSFSLNGFTGNQIKFFIDGIPMDNFGSSLTLNNIPVNQISRIEIYKGVVPVYLGGDALGGAVNIVTNQAVENYLDVSYSYGSFNTHKASVLSRYYNKEKGVLVSANAFFNYSDNNFNVDVQIPEEGTGIVDGYTRVKRFHDAYQSQTIQVEAGVVNKKYADKFLVGLIASSNKNEWQTGNTMTTVLGKVHTTDKVLIPTLKYEKRDLFTEGLDAKIYAIYNEHQKATVDTVSRKYDWTGNYVLNETTSEGEYGNRKSLFTFKDKSITTGTSFVYKLNDKHTFSINNTFSSTTRVGEDLIEGVYKEKIEPFAEPNTLTKNITGISYSLNLLEGKWKTNVFAKGFLMRANTQETYSLVGGGDVMLRNLVSNNFYKGFGIASTYFITKATQIKASFENTWRLPTSTEMFGDGFMVDSNPSIAPEQSKNYNLGILTRKRINKHEFIMEGSYLYRLPKNLINLTVDRLSKHYVNLAEVKINSIEGSIRYKYNKFLNLEINATYQDLINTNEYLDDGFENNLYLDRLPNKPFLFGNFTAGLQLPDLWKEEDALAFNWSTHFVEAFYLNWPSQGNSNGKFDIPRQISHNLFIAYSLSNGEYNISLGCTNLFDKILYDNFQLQKPGRAVSLKLRWFLNKNN